MIIIESLSFALFWSPLLCRMQDIGDFGLIGCRCAKRWASTGGRRAKCGVDDRCRVWKHQCRPVDTGLVDALFLGSTRDTADNKMASRVGCGPTKPAFFGVDERHRSSYHPYQGVDVACRRTKSQPYVTTFRDHTAVIGVGYQFRRDVPR